MFDIRESDIKIIAWFCCDEGVNKADLGLVSLPGPPPYWIAVLEPADIPIIFYFFQSVLFRFLNKFLWFVKIFRYF